MRAHLPIRTAVLVAAVVTALLGRDARAQTILPVRGIAPAQALQDSGNAARRASARDLLDAERGEDLLRGNGSRLGYVLTQGNLVPGSVTVLLDGVRLTPGTGYSLDLQSGALTLAQPARPQQSIIVRYRYRPGGANAAGASLLGLPLLTFKSAGGGSVGLSLGVNRAENGVGTTTLLGLRSDAGPAGRGLSGLMYLTGGGTGAPSRSLLSDPPKKPAAPASGYLIDQKLALGGAKNGVTLSYQDVSAGFSGFAALRAGGGAAANALSQLEKEKGIKRLGLTGNVSLGGTVLGFSHSDLSAQGKGITRQGLTVKAGGLSLTANYLDVDAAFTRFNDLAEADREALAKFKGGKRYDLGGEWALGKALKFDGSFLDLSQGANKQKNARTRLQFTPGKATTLQYLSESASKTENGKTVETTTRQYELQTDPKASSSFNFLSRSLSTRKGGQDKDETTTRFAGTSLMGGRRGLEFRGLRETYAADESDGKAAGVATTLYGFRTMGGGPLRLNFEAKNIATEATGAADKRDALTLWDGGYQWGKNTRTSFTLSSQTIAQGAARTRIGKQAWGLEFGRGYAYKQSREGQHATDGKQETARRTEFQQIALDPKLPITGTGERRAAFLEDGKSEITEKWSGKATVGKLMLKTDGYDIRRVGLALKSEKVQNFDGRLPLFRDWIATYGAYDRALKDPKTKVEMDEIGSELAVTGRVGTMGITLKEVRFDNRLDKIYGFTRNEITVVPLKPITLGPLKKSRLTVSYAADKVQEKAEGRTRRIAYDGMFGPHRVAFEYGDTITYQGPDTVTKSLLFDSDPNRRLHVLGQYKVRNVQGEAPIFVRAWTVDLKIAANQKFNYNYQVNPEQPNGAIRRVKSETAAYVADLGRGGKAAAGYKFINDFDKKTVTRGASFSLLSPTSDVTAYEFQYAREMTLTPEGRLDTQSYALKYLFQPGEDTHIEVMAKWIDRTGTNPKKVEPSEAQANVDVKVGLFD